MLQSLCIKTNNEKILNYLLEKLDSNTFVISKNKFKIYNNIIIHNIDNAIDFYDILSDYITDSIVTFYEKDLVKKIINNNYFYFSDSEKSVIYKNTVQNLLANTIEIKGTIFLSVLKYILDNNTIILDGFINFRLKDYISILDTYIDSAVDNFLIEREYLEFINLLKVYIESKPSTIPLVHLIYYNKEAILLDEQINIIDIDDNISTARYLSDITFSRNDFVLNTLLNLIPKRIVFHLLDSTDEFIDTIKLIFENRITICNTCNLCKNYTIHEETITAGTNKKGI